jgi:putative hemolysin
MLPLTCTLNEAFIKAHLDMHTRFPVCEVENDPQTITGYVNFKDIPNALRMNPSDPTIRGITRPIARFDENTPLSQALERMIREKNHIALIVSGESKVTGLITLEDIIEELVGEIEDEYDRIPSYLHPYGSGLIAGGGASMGAIMDKLGIQPQPEPDTHAKRSPTLHEWCVERLNRLPKGGDIIVDAGLQVSVRKIRRKKVSEAAVNRTE